MTWAPVSRGNKNEISLAAVTHGPKRYSKDFTKRKINYMTRREKRHTVISLNQGCYKYED